MNGHTIEKIRVDAQLRKKRWCPFQSLDNDSYVLITSGRILKHGCRAEKKRKLWFWTVSLCIEEWTDLSIDKCSDKDADKSESDIQIPFGIQKKLKTQHSQLVYIVKVKNTTFDPVMFSIAILDRTEGEKSYGRTRDIERWKEIQ